MEDPAAVRLVTPALCRRRGPTRPPTRSQTWRRDADLHSMRHQARAGRFLGRADLRPWALLTVLQPSALGQATGAWLTSPATLRAGAQCHVRAAGAGTTPAGSGQACRGLGALPRRLRPALACIALLGAATRGQGKVPGVCEASECRQPGATGRPGAQAPTRRRGPLRPMGGAWVDRGACVADAGQLRFGSG